MPPDPKDIARVTAAATKEAETHAERFKDLPRQRLAAETPAEVNPMVSQERAVPIEVEMATARKISERTREEMRRRVRPFARR